MSERYFQVICRSQKITLTLKVTPGPVWILYQSYDCNRYDMLIYQCKNWHVVSVYLCSVIIYHVTMSRRGKGSSITFHLPSMKNKAMEMLLSMKGYFLFHTHVPLLSWGNHKHNLQPYITDHVSLLVKNQECLVKKMFKDILRKWIPNFTEWHQKLDRWFLWDKRLPLVAKRFDFRSIFNKAENNPSWIAINAFKGLCATGFLDDFGSGPGGIFVSQQRRDL